MGIINAGTSVGAVIAPPLIAIILEFLELEMDLRDFGSARSALDGVVASGRIFSPADPQIETADRWRISRRPSAGSICCESVKSGEW